MKLGLNFKFISYTVFIIVFISLVFSLVFIYQSRNAILDEFTKRAHSLVNNLALNAEIPLFLDNKAALYSLAENLLQETDVQSVKILNHENTELVNIEKPAKLLPWQKELIVSPVYFSAQKEKELTEPQLFFTDKDGQKNLEDQKLGIIEVVFSRESIIKTLNTMRWWIFTSAAFAAIIGGIAGLYFSRTLILPIQRLAKAAYSIARGKWDEHLEGAGSDELGQLTESFNIMAASLVTKKQELEKTFKELAQKEKMAEIGKFSMIIAHELKNPLGIIKGSIDILSKPSCKDKMKNTMIDYIKDEVKRLNKIIEDFLAFSKPAPPNKTPANINKIIENISNRFVVPEEEKKEIYIRTSLEKLPSVNIDEHQFYHALLNLINNSINAIEQKGEIFIQTTHIDSNIVITVEDTGTGIPFELKDRIFDPFYTTKAKGTGLGLSIVKKIIENHDGLINLAKTGTGKTAFEIIIPCKQNNRT